jgi:hypothetical protein
MMGGVHDAWNEGMAIATEAYSEMLSACIKESGKLGSLPHAIGNAVVLSYAAVSMGITHFRQIHSGEPLPSSLDIRASWPTSMYCWQRREASSPVCCAEQETG